MASFTYERIHALVPNARPDIAQPVAVALEKHAADFDVTTLLRRALLMAQLAVESAGFTRLEENLNYSHADRIARLWPRLASRAATLVHNPQVLANAAYANKNGNGDEISCDGWRYRGRGLIQLTGKANYAGACGAAGVDLVVNPAAAAVPDTAVRIALWFWQSKGCNEPADRDNADAVTRIINGPAMNQANVRHALSERAKAIFS